MCSSDLAIASLRDCFDIWVFRSRDAIKIVNGGGGYGLSRNHGPGNSQYERGQHKCRAKAK